MRRWKDPHNNFGVLWTAATRNFTVEWRTEQSFEKYDGDDEDGSIQADLDSGELVMFDSSIRVLDHYGKEIAADYLGASVYKSGEVLKFIHDGYFMDMLNMACLGAREHYQKRPVLRPAA
ncbi:hypothetical protein [Rhizobium sp. CECT 9324]|uniref:hypothetical protein n=1 Tax=Rhizobium sp. CECT 9324 TaxID=2845820 RepID=UPI001E2E8D6B|nr:hypothetical protein [Rhizobium sp. CECT 9324]CAH0342319.1 hypothetical protein RHI9324_04042 [Rhizobium sp. CECT 9324]CAH0343760.1 hypothetical protein RHI9324_05498 [Rhizobium sp. CECT 9324]